VSTASARPSPTFAPGCSMPSQPEEVMSAWLADFDRAVRSRDPAAISGLFRADGYWSDSPGTSAPCRAGRRSAPQ
jgi:hypothetical protein